MKRKIVTIFGGSGFLGRYLVKRLCLVDWEVRVAVRDHEAAQFLKPMGRLGQIVIWQTDILKKDQVEAAIRGADAVVNLVGILFCAGSNNFENIHTTAAQNIAELCSRVGVDRLIHISALGADLDSKSIYAQTKAKGEIVGRKHFPSLIIIRPSVVFGPEDGFFNLFASFARFLPFLPVYGCKGLLNVRVGNGSRFFGNGGTKFQPVYVGDVAEAIVKCLIKNNVKGKTFELGGPKIYSFKDLMLLILHITNRRCFLIPIPFKLAMLQAFFLQMLPRPLLTCDQVELLKTDNVVQNDCLGFKELGIEPSIAEIILPTYLKRFVRRPRVQ